MASIVSGWLITCSTAIRVSRPGGVWECWTVLAALAEATQRVEIGTLVLCNSLRNPAVLAKMATAIDEVSHGRLILGVGAGWNEPEYRAFGLPFDQRVDRFEEALQIIRPLLRDGHVDFTGRYYQAPNCEDLPRGPRADGPPLLVGSEGPRMLRLTAQYADLWNIGYMGVTSQASASCAKIIGVRHGSRSRTTRAVCGMTARVAPMYKFVGRSCWQFGFVAAFDPARWRAVRVSVR